MLSCIYIAGKIKIKKYKKRLLEKGNKQLIRIIREIDDEEVRAEQAIEELSYNLSNIVKTMVYVQGMYLAENRTLTHYLFLWFRNDV